VLLHERLKEGVRGVFVLTVEEVVVAVWAREEILFKHVINWLSIVVKSRVEVDINVVVLAVGGLHSITETREWVLEQGLSGVLHHHVSSAQEERLQLSVSVVIIIVIEARIKVASRSLHFHFL